MVPTATIVKRKKLEDLYRYRVVDAQHRHHTVEIPAAMLAVSPREFMRGTDEEHLDIIACGTVIMRFNEDAIFHKVDRSMINRAYDAALRSQFSVGVIY
jgi:hypothetical protein